jgi:hypothetical protein
MANLHPSNSRKSFRCPLVGTNDGELELPQGERVPVRIENESAGGFGIYCNADLNIREDESLLLYCGSDAYEVCVAHVNEVDVPPRSGEPEPEWLPFRIGLERGRLVASSEAPSHRKRWRQWLCGPGSRPAARPMIAVGLLLAVIFVAAPYLSVMSGTSDHVFFVSLRATNRSFLDTVTSWFLEPAPDSHDQSLSSSSSPWWQKTTDKARLRLDSLQEKVDAAAVPIHLKANAAVDDTQQWIDATAKNAAENAALLQEDAARETDRWMETGSEVLDAMLEDLESLADFEERDATVATTETAPEVAAPEVTAPESPTAAPGIPSAQQSSGPTRSD